MKIEVDISCLGHDNVSPCTVAAEKHHQVILKYVRTGSGLETRH